VGKELRDRYFEGSTKHKPRCLSGSLNVNLSNPLEETPGVSADDPRCGYDRPTLSEVRSEINRTGYSIYHFPRDIRTVVEWQRQYPAPLAMTEGNR
jgi:hypothetical protein